MNKLFNIEKLKETSQLFPLITALVFVFGYIGFNTFRAINEIPYLSPDYSLIIGIGLLNAVYLLIIYSLASKKRKPTLLDAVMVFTYMNLFMINPLILAVFLLIYIFLLNPEWTDIRNRKSKKKEITFSKKKDKVDCYNLLIPFLNITIAIICILLSIFYDGDIWNIVFMIYVVLYIFYKQKRNELKVSFVMILLLLLFPVITMSYLINKSEVSILGLNKQYVEIETIDNIKINGSLVYKDDKSAYIINDSLKSTIALNISQIKKITSNKYHKRGEPFLESYKSYFKKTEVKRDTCFYSINVPADIDLPSTPHYDTSIVRKKECSVNVLELSSWGSQTSYILSPADTTAKNIKKRYAHFGIHQKGILDITDLPAGLYNMQLYACGNGGQFTVRIK